MFVLLTLLYANIGNLLIKLLNYSVPRGPFYSQGHHLSIILLLTTASYSMQMALANNSGKFIQHNITEYICMIS